MQGSRKSLIILGAVIAVLLLWIVYRETQPESTDTNNAPAASQDEPTDTQPNDNEEPNDETPNDETGPYSFTSIDGVTIRLDDIESGSTISSPLTITGEVPGNWSFEASFPVVLTDWDGLIIAEEPAVLQGDWMTEDYVPFSVTLTFDTPSVRDNGSLILQKSNPSGLAANDDAVEIPIVFEQ